MATMNYNEITNSAEVEAPVNMVKDPMFHWDTHFPGRVSCLRGDDSPVGRRKGRRRRDRNNARYKTQPITFDEIKEMDEETVDDKDTLKTQFTVFSRSMDGLGKMSDSNRLHHSDLTRSSGDSSDDSSSTAVSARQKFQQRRKKNMHNSIEEIPEREKCERK